MSKKEKFITPIDKELLRILESQKTFYKRLAFSELASQLEMIDKEIQEMPDGDEKELCKKEQEQAWIMLLSEDLVQGIEVEE